MRSFTVIAAALAGLSAAGPLKPRDSLSAGIVFISLNGSFTQPASIPLNGETQQLVSPGFVNYFFIAPPFVNGNYVPTECSFQAVGNNTGGAITAPFPVAVPLNPPTFFGSVNCQSA